MIVAFFGHRNFVGTREHKGKIFSELGKFAADEIRLYFGGYGGFDAFAYSCCKEYKLMHKGISLIYVTPYITVEYQKNVLSQIKSGYDGIIYPEIERAPLKYAISYRNRWIAERADIIISAVDRCYGGAYQACAYAKRKGKRIINILSDIT